MKKSKRFFSSLVAASVLTLNVSAFPTNSIYDFCSAKAFAEETVELSDGEYPVNLSVDCYESDRSATFSDYFRIDLAKLIVSTNQTTNQKQYYLCLPVDYFESSLFNSISLKFGYSFSKYSSEENISFGDIVSQEGYTSFNENVAVSDLSQLSDDTSANCYMYKVALQNLNDELYIYFSDRFSSNERLLIKVNDIGSTQKYEHYSPEVSNFTFNKVQELYYQDKRLNERKRYSN